MPSNLNDWLIHASQLTNWDIDLGLDRIAKVYNKLAQQPIAPLIINVAGTNGKGSSVAYLENILTQAGYRTFSYTSPHLWHFNERIKLDANPVSNDLLCAAFTLIEQLRADVLLTAFEFESLVAMQICMQSDCDVAIFEVGLGGRLDAVNILDADLALITGVDIDHTAWLGETREVIAVEKAGIIRSNKPLVFAEADIPDSIIDIASQKSVAIYSPNKDYQYVQTANTWSWKYFEQNLNQLPIPNMHGAMQIQNAAAVLMVLNLLKTQIPVSESNIKQGIINSKAIGRQQLLTGSPDLLIDAAHNPQAVHQLVDNIIQRFDYNNVVVIIAIRSDKDITSIAKILAPIASYCYICPHDDNKGQENDTWDAMTTYLSTNICEKCDTVEQALIAAQQRSAAADLIVAVGSFVTAAKAISLAPQYGWHV